MVTEAVSLLFRCVEKAKIAPEEVGQLIVVGGSSKLELLRQELEESLINLTQKADLYCRREDAPLPSKELS